MSNYICIKNCDAAARLTILCMYMDSGSVLRRNTLIKEIDSVAAITKSPLPHIHALATGVYSKRVANQLECENASARSSTSLLQDAVPEKM